MKEILKLDSDFDLLTKILTNFDLKTKMLIIFYLRIGNFEIN